MRSALGTVVGFAIVAIVLYWLFGFIIGTLFWLIRGVLLIVVLLVLITIYAALKRPGD